MAHQYELWLEGLLCLSAWRPERGGTTGRQTGTSGDVQEGSNPAAWTATSENVSAQTVRNRLREGGRVKRRQVGVVLAAQHHAGCLPEKH